MQSARGVPRQEVGGLAPGVGPPLTSYPIIPRSQHDNPFVGPIGKLPASLSNTRLSLVIGVTQLHRIFMERSISESGLAAFFTATCRAVSVIDVCAV